MFEQTLRRILIIEKACNREHLRLDGCDAWPLVRWRLWSMMTSSFDQSFKLRPNKVTRVLRLFIKAKFEIFSQRTFTENFSDTGRLNVPSVFTFSRLQHFVLTADPNSKLDRVLEPIAQKLSDQYRIEKFVLTSTPIENLSPNFTRFNRSILFKPCLPRGIFSSGLFKACRAQGINTFKLVGLLIFDGLVFVSARKSMHYYCSVLSPPTFALVDTWYSPDMMGLISFLREHKVTVIEIQHGFINPHHAMYINWPSESSSAKSLRPNVFWSWSALANKMLDIANYPCHTGEKVFVGGYPWSYLRAKNLKFFETQNNTEITRSKPEYRSIRVLLTLGALQTEECEDLPDYLLELIYLRTDISFTLLPHPNDPNPRRYLESRFVTGQPENVIVAQINTDLYSLLDNSTHHITAMSTAAIEAQYLGIPTLMSSKLGQVLFSSLIDNRLIFVSYGNRESVENFLNQKRVPVQTKSTYISSSAELLENGIKICVKAAKL